MIAGRIGTVGPSAGKSEAGPATQHDVRGPRPALAPRPSWAVGASVPTALAVAAYLQLVAGAGAAILGGGIAWTLIDSMNPAKDVLALSSEPSALSIGHAVFTQNCAGCHGADAHGALGFPNLTDNDWLYGGAHETIVETITKGRNGNMPAHKDTLGPAKAHLLAAYVWGLSNGAKPDQKAEATTNRASN